MPNPRPTWPKTIALAMTGASGTQYGLRLLECLIQAGVRVYLMVSQAGQIVLKMEAGLTIPSNPADMERFFTERFQRRPRPVAGLWAPGVDGACGERDQSPGRHGGLPLHHRHPGQHRRRGQRRPHRPRRRCGHEGGPQAHPGGARDPLLRHPPGEHAAPGPGRGRHHARQPGLLLQPRSVADIIDFMVARVLDHLGVAHQLGRRWGEEA